jgi:WD40 repeat protein
MRVALFLLAGGILASGSNSGVAQTPAADAGKPGKVDLYGDPLPPGAMARLGTVRWRHEALSAAVFGPEGKTVITSGGDGTIRVWEVSSGKQVRRFGSPFPFSPGSPQAETAVLMAQVSARFSRLFGGLAIAGDRKLLASSGTDKTIILWEVATGKEVRRLTPDKPSESVRWLDPITFSPDRKYLVAWENQRFRENQLFICLFDIATGKEVLSFRRTIPVNQPETIIGMPLAAFSSDAKQLTWAEQIYDRPRSFVRVYVWEVTTGKELLQTELPGQIDYLHALSPDGRVVVKGAPGMAVSLWDLAANKEILHLEKDGHNAEMTFSPDGKLLALWDGTTLRLLDAATGKGVRTLSDQVGPGERRAVRRLRPGLSAPILAFSPDGSSIVVERSSNTLQVWDVVNGNRRGLVAGHEGAVEALALSPVGRTAVTVGADEIVRQWDIATGKEIRLFPLGSGASKAAFSPDGRLVGWRGHFDAIHLWEVGTGKELRRLEDEEERGRDLYGVKDLAFSPDGKTLVSRTSRGILRFWDTTNGKERYRKSGLVNDELSLRREPNPVTFSAHSRVVAWVNLEKAEGPRRLRDRVRGSIQLAEVATGQLIRSFDKQEGTLVALAFSPDGRSLGAANEDETISLWEIATGKKRLQTQVNRRAIRNSWKAIAFSPDGRLLATGGEDRMVRLWDTATGQDVTQFAGHNGAVLSIVFTPDGKRLVSASADSTALVWEVPTRPAPSLTLEAAQVEHLWADLKADDAAKAYQAVCTLSADPARAVAFMGKELRPASAPDPKRISRLVADLDSNQFETREKATRELEQLGKAAEPALRQVLTGDLSAEVRKRLERLLAAPEATVSAPEDLRAVRAVEVLSRIGTAEAKEVLQTLAHGAAGDRLTREAKATLERLEKPPTPKP